MTSRRQKRPALEDRFWETRPLQRLSPAEWEALCDGCAKCCLLKLEDIDTGETAYTDVACRLLDEGSCRCTDYENRHQKVPGCVRLTPKSLPKIAGWMPPTCAYRLIYEGKPLPGWHYLVSGDRQSVHEAGMSVRGRTRPEAEVDEDTLEEHVVAWPCEVR